MCSWSAECWCMGWCLFIICSVLRVSWIWKCYLGSRHLEPGEGHNRGLLRDCETIIFAKVRFQLYCQRVLHLSEDRLRIRLRWCYHNFLLCLEIICNNTVSHPPHSTLYILHWMLYQLLSICPTTLHLSQFSVLIQHHDNDAFVVFIHLCIFSKQESP